MKQVKVDSEIEKIKAMTSNDVLNYIKEHDDFKVAMAKVLIAKSCMLKEEKYKDLVRNPELMMHKHEDYNMATDDADVELVCMMLNWNYYLTKSLANIGDVVKYGNLYYEVKMLITFDSEVEDVPIIKTSIYKFCPAYVLEEVPFRSIITSVPICTCTVEDGESNPLDVIETLRLISIGTIVGQSLKTGVPLPNPLQIRSDMEKTSLYDHFYSHKAEMSRAITITRNLFPGIMQ